MTAKTQTQRKPWDHAARQAEAAYLRDLRQYPQPVKMCSQLAVYRALQAGIIEKGTRCDVVMLRYASDVPTLVQPGEFVSWERGYGGCATWTFRYDGQDHDTCGMLLNGRELWVRDEFSDLRAALADAADLAARAIEDVERYHGSEVEPDLTYTLKTMQEADDALERVGDYASNVRWFVNKAWKIVNEAVAASKAE